eukprot:CAMPEP_0202742398 /NCGR_PEP_ID=MMETSP1388-20130828/5003_1 /ASSEMBLY_ACC=CAM_ASM_000864 /TAXON_ID=37098 /ORGANISM="Isochrysis sp, Strain CCMP1244" /LENGTH=301 /DNA_ID=CAMNT_0049409317 /DNA_START=199 /DNA_END=1101 /DNA_ORIENTATION=-
MTDERMTPRLHPPSPPLCQDTAKRPAVCRAKRGASRGGGLLEAAAPHTPSSSASSSWASGGVAVAEPSAPHALLDESVRREAVARDAARRGAVRGRVDVRRRGVARRAKRGRLGGRGQRLELCDLCGHRGRLGGVAVPRAVGGPVLLGGRERGARVGAAGGACRRGVVEGVAGDRIDDRCRAADGGGGRNLDGGRLRRGRERARRAFRAEPAGGRAGARAGWRGGKRGRGAGGGGGGAGGGGGGAERVWREACGAVRVAARAGQAAGAQRLALRLELPALLRNLKSSLVASDAAGVADAGV